jgi:hypothetical protein
MRHRCITNGGTADDAYNDTLLLLKAKLALTNKGLHDFSKMSLALPPIKMLRVNPQLAAELTTIEMYSMATSTKIYRNLTFVKKQLSLQCST